MTARTVRCRIRTFQALSAIFILLILLTTSGCTQETETTGEGDGAQSFFWDREAGAEIKLLANDHPWVSLIEERVHEFTDMTGIEVSIDVYPEEQFRAKREVEMRSGTTDIDVFMLMPGQSLTKYAVEQWASSLEELMDEDALRWPHYDMDDFYDVVVESGRREDVQYTLPILLETSLLAYNTEIFERFDLSPPQTMDELRDAARTVYEGTDGEVAGITLRGDGTAATSQWADFLYSFGGQWFDEAGNAAIHYEPAIEALRFYGNLLREYGPRGASGNRWYESVSLFSSGRAAMIYDANVFRSNYENPEFSDVAGSVGYAQIPEGPAGRVPHISHWGLAVYEHSPQKEAAWLFIQWATGAEISRAAHERGIPAARESVWVTHDSTSQWTAASTRNYEIAESKWNPPVMNVDDAREAVGSAIVAAILSEDVARAAQHASEELDRIVAESAEVADP